MARACPIGGRAVAGRHGEFSPASGKSIRTGGGMTFAQPPFAQLPALPTAQDRFELAWLEALRDEPTWFVAAAAAVAALVAWAIWMYWRERRATAAPVWMGLLALRL